MKKILVINLGSTSSKIAYFEDDACVVKENIPHPAEEIRRFPTIWDQKEYRMAVIRGFMDRHGIRPEELDGFTSRGGHTEPITGGVYRITEKMLEQSRSEAYGNHISDLGLQIAAEFSRLGPLAFTADSPCTDEFEPLARYSGLPEIQRTSRFHALNHKAVARIFCDDHGLDYHKVNLIVVHMGGGTSVAAHKNGLMIDGTNGLDGDGPFSTNRTGALPVGPLVDLCYSGQYDHRQMRRKINGLGGLMAYVGDTDVRSVCEKREAGDKACGEALDAMIYQTAKEIGGAATVLKGQVDAILFTGGIMNSPYVREQLRERVSFIADVYVYPGEWEMDSLGKQTYLALTGREEIKELI